MSCQFPQVGHAWWAWKRQYAKGDIIIWYLLINHGRYTISEYLFSSLFKDDISQLGEEHPDTLTSMGNLASTYKDQGRWMEAEKLDISVMEIRKRVLGEEHPDMLSSMANLASTYWDQG
jgi:Tetratricopeptide repeat